MNLRSLFGHSARTSHRKHPSTATRRPIFGHRFLVESLEDRKLLSINISDPIYWGDIVDNVAYDSGPLNDGILTITGDLTFSDDGSIHANDDRFKAADPPLPTGASAFPITIIVSGDVLMAAGTGIFAENQRAGGNGGDISLTVDGNFTMQAASGALPGAQISSSKTSGAGDTGVAGNISIDVGKNVDLGVGSVIKANGAGSGGDISFTVDGSFTMHGTAVPFAGALISSDGGSVGKGGDITIDVTGDVLMETGTKILSDGVSGGAIEIDGENVDIDGTVSSHGTETGTGAVQPPGGGTITVIAKDVLTVSDTGVVSSSGLDPGADLVHLEGCHVFIYGLVESTGHGHAVPNNPPNHLNDHPNHPADSTAGVEIWADELLVIDSTGTHKGQVSADLSIGASKRSWIDLFASGDIQIIGQNPATGTFFSVHATNAGNVPTGGQITIVSTEGTITAGGLAVNAGAQTIALTDPPDGNAAGGTGGLITIAANKNITLDTATIMARGDDVPTVGAGGKINVRSATGAISWLNGVGDVRPTGADNNPANPNNQLPASQRGVITLQAALLMTTTGTSFPFMPPASITDPTTPTVIQNTPSAAPTLPDYVVLPECLDDPLDFGDAPENPIVPGDYPTTLANNGARHVIIAGFHLGANIDAETDGQPNGTATGDDANPIGGPDDEDGVVFNSPFVPGLDTSITVTLTGATGKLDAWIDWNGDGDWNDLNEQIFTNQVLASGANNLTVDVPVFAVVSVTGAPTFARFRLSTAGNLAPTGIADDGEVEDYKLQIFPYWTSKGAVISQIEQNTRPPGNVPDSGNCFAIPDVLVDVDSGPVAFDATKVGTLAPATKSIQAAVNYVNAFGVSPISGVSGDVNGDGFLIIAVTAKDSLTTFTVTCGGETHTVVGRELGGDGTENYVITNTKTARLNVFGNSVNMHAANAANPVATIKSSVGKVTYLDVHTWDSNVAGVLVGGATAATKNADLVVVKNANAIHNLTGIGIWVQDDNVQVTGSQHIYQNKVGIQIDGDKNELRTNNEIMDNSQFGIKITGNNNELNDQDVGKSGHANAAGIDVTGNSNNIHDGTIAYNTGTGIKIKGNSNIVNENEVLNNGGDAICIVSGTGNQITNNDIFGNVGTGINVTGNSNVITKNAVGDKNKGNGGDGIRVTGGSNTIQENSIFSSGGDGLEVVGDSNTIYKNVVGDKNKGGNGLANVAGNRDGIRVTGKNNTLEENTTNANKGYGIYIAGATSTGNKLKNNKSNTDSSGGASENVLAEFKFDAAITNQGGNKKDNANFTSTAAGTYE